MDAVALEWMQFTLEWKGKDDDVEIDDDYC